MIKQILLSTALVLSSAAAFATELTPSNLIGRYKVTAKAGFQTVYVNFRVNSSTEFTLQRTYPDGSKDAACDGTFKLNNSLYVTEDDVVLASKTFKGKMTCPDDRSKVIDFNIYFGGTTVEDLVAGTSVDVTSSMAPGMTLHAYVKKSGN